MKYVPIGGLHGIVLVVYLDWAELYSVGWGLMAAPAP
jgi:hypothetical protein